MKCQSYIGERPKRSFLPLKQFLDKHISHEFVKTLESNSKFFRLIWYEQSPYFPWFDDETKSCIRFLQASKHDISLPLLTRYFQENAADIPIVTKIVVAFYALWRTALPTNRLPSMYRELFTAHRNDNMAISGGTLKSVQDLAAYFRAKLEERLGQPPQGKTLEEHWLSDENQRYLDYETLKVICRLFIFLDIGHSIKYNLIANDPWTSLDDLEHVFPSGSPNPPLRVHSIGNLTFLPSKINQSIQDMQWDKKREVYCLLADSQRQNPSPTSFSDGSSLPVAVRDYLADERCEALIHLQSLTTNIEWGEEQISNRSTQILKNVWRVLYENWLHP
jgi:hypothetical protein